MTRSCRSSRRWSTQRDPNIDYYARGTFTSHNLDFAEDVLSIADAGFDRLSVEPVTAGPEAAAYDLTEDDLPKIEAEYDRLTEIMLERKKEGKPFTLLPLHGRSGPGTVRASSGCAGCGAGYEYVAVTPDGDIYPCHQFVGKEEFKQGSVLDQSFDMDIASTLCGHEYLFAPEVPEMLGKVLLLGRLLGGKLQHEPRYERLLRPRLRDGAQAPGMCNLL